MNKLGMPLSKAEAQKVKGGFNVVGVEWDGWNCTCDIRISDKEILCGQPCNNYNCSKAFPGLRIPF